MTERVTETEQTLSSRQYDAPRKGWYVVALCTVAYLFSFIDRQILALLIEPIRADLHITDTQFGLLHGLAFALFYATMGIPIASLADRISRPFIISFGVLFWSAATMACGTANNFLHMFLARIGVGAGEAALSPATYSLISDLFPREKLGRAVAVYSLGSFLGAGIAFLVGGAVIMMIGAAGDWQLGGLTFRPWQVAFLLVGFPGILLGLVIALTVRDPRQEKGAGETSQSPAFAVVLAYLRQEWRIFLPHMVGFSMTAMTLYTLLGWSPAWLMRVHDLSQQETGLWLGLIAILGGGGGVLTSGIVMDRIGKSRNDGPFLTGVIGAAGVIVPVFALPFATSLDAALLLLGLAMFFASFPMPPSTAVMQIAAPPRMRSRVAALFLCLNSLGGMALGAFLVGYLNDHVFADPHAVGHSIAIVAGGAAILSALILSCGMRPFRRHLAMLA